MQGRRPICRSIFVAGDSLLDGIIIVIGRDDSFSTKNLGRRRRNQKMHSHYAELRCNGSVV